MDITNLPIVYDDNLLMILQQDANLTQFEIWWCATIFVTHLIQQFKTLARCWLYDNAPNWPHC